MTPIVQSVAYFKVCHNCGNHGWIITSSGEESDNCVTKRAAHKWLKILSEQEGTTPEEISVVREQIESSPLPEQDDVLETLAELEARIDLIEEIIGDPDEDEPEEESEAPDPVNSPPTPRILQ